MIYSEIGSLQVLMHLVFSCTDMRVNGYTLQATHWNKLSFQYLVKISPCLFSCPFTHDIFRGNISGVLRILLYLERSVTSSFCSHLLDCASDGFLSLCLLFLNQLLTWVKESPVILARFLFSAGEGYLF